MYRIRTASGQEQLYRSIQELTAGVQRGEVTAEAEIYHQRSERWLSIQTHPHYKMAADGGATTPRSQRLKLTRPATPAPTSGVRPTPPAAQQPGQTDLEELNRLLVLLDPLPTPAQRAEPEPPAVPPALSLVRSGPAPVPSMSADDQPQFGTMLRLEDLEPMPKAEPPQKQQLPEALEVIRDDRVLPDEEPATVTAALEPVETAAEFVSSDFGLPVEIRLDEIPVPDVVLAAEPELEQAPDFIGAEASILPAEESPVPVDFAPVPAPEYVASESIPSSYETPEPTAEPEPIARRRKPMLYVAAAAVIAMLIFAFMSRQSNGNEGMVTLASATAPSAGLTAAPSQPAHTTPDSPPTTLTATPVPVRATHDAGPATRDSVVPGPVLPSAPSIDLSGAGTDRVDAGPAQPRAASGEAAALARSYASAYTGLERDFNAQMGRSGLVRLFSQTQLTTTDGLTGARSALDAAATAVRQYHAREAAIERAYQDSARSIERAGVAGADLRDWMTHPVLKESQEAAGESVRLIGQIDAAFALLQSQAGHYRVEGTTIRFDDADAAARYTDLQSWITRRMEHWSGQPASSVPTTLQPLLDGIGLTRLPATR